MTAKEYLNQAYKLDLRIDTKIKQLDNLKDLAVKCTAALSGIPHNPSRSKTRMADTIEKIVDLQNEINTDIDRLIDLKREIVQVIKSVPDPEQQTILEKRYLCYLSWEQIAVDMNYSIQHIFRLHDKALENIKMRVNVIE